MIQEREGTGAGLNGSVPPSRFWRERPTARKEAAYGEPPLLPGEQPRSGAAACLAPLKEMLAEKFPLRAETLGWKLQTGPLAAAEEHDGLIRELRADRDRRGRAGEAERRRVEAQIERLGAEREDVRQARAAAGLAFQEGMAGCGLPAGGTEPGPDAVEEALCEAAPTLEELAGEHMLRPPEEEPSWPARLGGMVFAGLAPVVCGFMLALCLGTLVGLLSLATLQRSDRLPQVLAAAVLGNVIVYALGAATAAACELLGAALERRGAPGPRSRGDLFIAACCCAGPALLVAAEVGAEGLGLRELHLQRLEEMRRMGGGAGAALLPTWAYLLMGTLISGPYVCYKAVKGWAEGQNRAREAWLLHLRRGWIEARRAEPEVRAAQAAAGRAAWLGARERELDARIEALEAARAKLEPEEGFSPAERAILDDARSAEVALTARFQAELEELVDAAEPVRRRWTGLFG